MASDNDIGFSIYALIDGLKESMAQATQSVTQFSEQSVAKVEAVGATFEKLNVLMLRFAAVLAGGLIFKDVIEATEQWNEQVRQLSVQLGINTDAASGLDAALKLIGVSTETYTSAALKLDRQVRTNEASINELGVATRNVNTGALLPQQQIMQNAITTLNQYEAGTNRNIASQILFGRGAGDLTNLLRLNNEVLEKGAEDVEKFGLSVDQDGIDSSLRFKQSVAELDLAILGLEHSLGEKIIPALTSLAQGFTTVVIPAINATITAVQKLTNGLGEAFAIALAHNDKDLIQAVKDEANNVPYGNQPQKTGQKPSGTKQVPDDLLKTPAQQQTAQDNGKQEDKLRELAVAKDKLLADGQIQIEEQKNKELLDNETITNQQYLAQKLQLQQQIDAIDLKAAQDKQDAIENDVVAYEKAGNDIIALKQKQAIAEEQIRHEIEVDAEKDNQKLVASINTSFETMFNGIVTGTKTIKSAFQDFTQSVLSQVEQIESKKFIEALLGGGTGSSGNGGGLGSLLVGGLSSGGSGIGNFLSGLIPSFDVGSWNVPNTTLATVHKGEMIIPAGQAGAARNGGMGGTNVTMHVYAQDAGSFRQNSGQMMADMAAQLRKAQRNM